MKREFLQIALGCLFAVLLSVGCGGGGSDSPSTPLDVADTWEITDTIGNNSCGDQVGQQVTSTITIIQDGKNLTVNTTVGSFTGTINGKLARKYSR